MAQVKKTLNDAELQIEINNLWLKGERGKSNIYELLRTDFKIEKSRTLKMYDIVSDRSSRETLQGQSDANVSTAKEAAEEGLYSHNEVMRELYRIMFDPETPIAEKLKAIEIHNKVNNIYTNKVELIDSSHMVINIGGEDIPID